MASASPSPSPASPSTLSRIGHTITGPHEYERDYKLRDLIRSSRKPEAINATTPLMPENATGWPGGDFRVRPLVEGPPSLAGVYTLIYKGVATIKTPGSPVSSAIPKPNGDGYNVIELNVAPKPGQSAQLTIDFLGTQGSVNDVHVMRPGYGYADLVDPNIASRVFLNLCEFVQAGPLRNLAWSEINGCAVKEWDGPDGFTPESRPLWNNGKRGAPITAFFKLAKEAGRPVWLQLPHLLSADGHRKLAQHALGVYPEDLLLWLEGSNEPWNVDPRFPQALSFIASAAALIAKGDTRFNTKNKWEAGLEYYILWFRDVIAIWRDVWGDRAWQLRPTINTHAHNSGTFDTVANFARKNLGGLKSFITDASTAGYWGGSAAFWEQDGLTVDAAINYLNANWDSWAGPDCQKWLSQVKAEGIQYASVYEGTLSTGEGNKNEATKLAVPQRPEVEELMFANILGWERACRAAGIEPGVWMNMLVANKHTVATTYGATTDGMDFTQPKIRGIATAALKLPLPKPDPTEASKRRIASLEAQIAALNTRIEELKANVGQLSLVLQDKQASLARINDALKQVNGIVVPLITS